MSAVLELDPPRAAARTFPLADYLELSKSRIVAMVLLTTAAGFLIADRPLDSLLLLHTLIGTALVAAGTNALNQYAERELDRQMHRTRRRPLPAGRIAPRSALLFSTAIALVGSIYLLLAVNWLTALLGIFTLTSYIFVYTPLKRVTTACTLIGAIPGAVPPLMGFAAATGSIGLGGLLLFALLFLWQMPHFMAISWMHRQDYGRAGFRMLSVEDEEGKRVAADAVLYSMLLLFVTIAPAFVGMAGTALIAGGMVASGLLLLTALRFLRQRTVARARTLFMTSNIYLLAVMLLFVFMVRG